MYRSIFPVLSLVSIRFNEIEIFISNFIKFKSRINFNCEELILVKFINHLLVASFTIKQCEMFKNGMYATNFH